MPARLAKVAVHAVECAASYIVGRDGEGHWVAVAADGRGGGLFRDRTAAIHYAEFETGHQKGAVKVVRQPLSIRF